MLRPARRVFVSAVPLFLLLATLTLNAAGRGAFQGYFNFRQVNVVGDQVSLTMDIRVLNHTGANVRNATVSIQGLYQSTASYGSFPALSFASGLAANATQIFNVPQKEFELWQSGARPRFVVSYTDAAGNTVQQPVELLRHPLKGGN